MAAATGTVAREGARTLSPPVVELDGVTQVVGGRRLWSDLTLRVEAGEFLAVLGPNGAGKTTLVRLVLGLLAPTAGRVLVNGREPQEQRGRIGYVPQQRAFDRDLLLRGRDLVRLGLDGNRWGVGVGRAGGRLVDDALAAAGATAFADRPLGRLSGGEQQRLRIAQALVRQPELILADEPLLSLDLAQQRTTVELIARQRRARGTPVVFVTHDVNPLLDHVDRVLYLSGTAAAVGSVEEVLTSETLSRLYGTAVDVLRVRGRIVVVGAPDTDWHHH